jgi:uncharacterized membrane protein YeaQ/YmgE (transglycosylase-associated protein family)
MTILEFLILLVIAAICGAIGQAIAGYTLGGMVITTVVGFIGAFVGHRAARVAHDQRRRPTLPDFVGHHWVGVVHRHHRAYIAKTTRLRLATQIVWVAFRHDLYV